MFLICYKFITYHSCEIQDSQRAANHPSDQLRQCCVVLPVHTVVGVALLFRIPHTVQNKIHALHCEVKIAFHLLI